ncbi:hypothetical protein AB0D14_19410 [Streptomyces sp. NPDC048484]|uniref:hypothetical protein n=1 Tax=Streptomyces sp. NPDC048484 TaxID=3155146 RepID=UPI00343A29E6
MPPCRPLPGTPDVDRYAEQPFARAWFGIDLLGRQLADLLGDRRIQADPGEQGVTASLCTAAGTGSYATIWSVLEAALPHLLRDPVVQGTGA